MDEVWLNRGGERPVHVAVIGAGAFGGCTALALAQRGARVTILDAWGAGHSRSSSGGETRVIRGVYGGSAIYTEWVTRSWPLWRGIEDASNRQLYHRTGCLWMCGADDSYLVSSQPLMERSGLSLEKWSLRELEERYPQIALAGIESAYYEPEAGYLDARDACRVIRDLTVERGARWVPDQVRPGRIDHEVMDGVRLSNGDALRADAFVFACGPWLGELFPDVIGEKVLPTRQEVFFFGTPPGDDRYSEEKLPVWLDFGERIFYGIPGNHGRGFKVADDTRGETVDPTSMDRVPTSERIERARELIARRFPGLAGAPLVESRVCQYENSPDGDFIIDRHPEARNVFLAGGGSGHGFKLAPALGEHVASMVLDGSEPLAMFRLDRFDRASKRTTQFSQGD